MKLASLYKFYGACVGGGATMMMGVIFIINGLSHDHVLVGEPNQTVYLVEMVMFATSLPGLIMAAYEHLEKALFHVDNSWRETVNEQAHIRAHRLGGCHRDRQLHVHGAGLRQPDIWKVSHVLRAEPDTGRFRTVPRTRRSNIHGPTVPSGDDAKTNR